VFFLPIFSRERQGNGVRKEPFLGWGGGGGVLQQKENKENYFFPRDKRAKERVPPHATPRKKEKKKKGVVEKGVVRSKIHRSFLPNKQRGRHGGEKGTNARCNKKNRKEKKMWPVV